VSTRLHRLAFLDTFPSKSDHDMFLDAFPSRNMSWPHREHRWPCSQHPTSGRQASHRGFVSSESVLSSYEHGSARTPRNHRRRPHLTSKPKHRYLRCYSIKIQGPLRSPPRRGPGLVVARVQGVPHVPVRAVEVPQKVAAVQAAPRRLLAPS
jgi:hypothetical protein